MIFIQKENIVNLAIPDHSATGLVNTIKMNKAAKVSDIKVAVDISHNYVSDLTVHLKAPSGQTVALHNRQGGGGANLRGNYSSDVLKDMIGQSAKGLWTLEIKDHAPRDKGILNSWKIDFTCEGKQDKSEIFIPDSDAESLNSVQECRHTGRVTGIKAMVDIEHSFIGDLKVELVAPSGKSVLLHNREGGSQNNLKKTYSGEKLQAMKGENSKGLWKLVAKDFAPRDKGRIVHWKVDLKIEAVDDLKKIEGIGPKIEQLLNNAGIYSFSELSVSAYDRLKAALDAGGDRFKMHDPTSWPQQSKLAADGQWDALKVLQDELDGGRTK